jgi:hypothetical protein
MGSVALFAIIGVVAGVKKVASRSKPVAVEKANNSKIVPASQLVPAKRVLQPSAPSSKPLSLLDGDLPQIDRIYQLFTTGPTKLPIVETITYESRVPWLKGRPAWIADYATHYATSRHFIARSLNGKADYFTQKVSAGSRFNVFRKDRNFQFYLLVDLALRKMGFYYLDLDTHERVLLKTYSVGLGKAADAPSGSLTPLGKFTLGNKVAVYKPGVVSLFQNQQVEMVRVFGTRWIPFEQPLDGSAEPKGIGIHGSPWAPTPKTDALVEQRNVVGTLDSDGSICLNQEDMEELFAIIITKPTIIEIVKNFKDARLPGVEVASPMRH